MASKAPLIAYSTVQYATQALRSGEPALALETIQANGNGLSPEQQADMETIIRESGEHALTERELNLAEDRLTGVLQPEMWQFMQNDALVAHVLFHFERDINFREDLRTAALGVIPKSHFRLNQLLLRKFLERQSSMDFSTVGKYRRKFRRLDNPKEKLSWNEFFALCPYLSTFTIDKKDEGKLHRIAKAIKASCPNFKVLILADTKNPQLKDCARFFAKFARQVQWPGGSTYTYEDLKVLTKFTLLQELHLLGGPDAFVISQDFEKFTQLKKLKIYLPDNQMEQASFARSIAKLPLKHLDLSEAEIRSETLPLFAPMTHLEIIDIGSTIRVTYEALRQFARAKPGTLKEIWLIHNLIQINQLQAEFHQIKFADSRSGTAFSKPVNIGGKLWLQKPL
jgi:hypothetical protein